MGRNQTLSKLLNRFSVCNSYAPQRGITNIHQSERRWTVFVAEL